MKISVVAADRVLGNRRVGSSDPGRGGKRRGMLMMTSEEDVLGMEMGSLSMYVHGETYNQASTLM